MSTLEMILTTCFGLGFLLMFGGVILSNWATQQMRVLLNSTRGAEDQLGWSDAIQRVAQKVIDEYRASYPDGPLYRKLVMGYSLAAVGGVLGIGSAFALKFAN